MSKVKKSSKIAKTPQVVKLSRKQQYITPELSAASLSVDASTLEKRTWSPARWEAQERRKLNKEKGDLDKPKRDFKPWSEARRASQLKAKEERDAKRLVEASEKASHTPEWSAARRAAQNRRPEKPVVIDVVGEIVENEDEPTIMEKSVEPEEKEQITIDAEGELISATPVSTDFEEESDEDDDYKPDEASREVLLRAIRDPAFDKTASKAVAEDPEAVANRLKEIAEIRARGLADRAAFEQTPPEARTTAFVNQYHAARFAGAPSSRANRKARLAHKISLFYSLGYLKRRPINYEVSYRDGFCRSRFSEVFRKAQARRRLFLGKRRHLPTRNLIAKERASLHLLFQKNTSRNQNNKASRRRRRLYRGWQKRLAKIKRRRELYTAKVCSKSDIEASRFRRRHPGLFFTDPAELKSVRAARIYYHNRWFERKVAWVDQWAVYFTLVLRKRARILRKLNYAWEDTLYYNYLRPVEEWKLPQVTAESWAPPALFFIAFSKLYPMYVEAYALKKRPYQHVIGYRSNALTSLIGPGDNYWKPDEFSDDDFADFTLEELFHYARGANSLIKKRPRPPIVVIVPSPSYDRRIKRRRRIRVKRRLWRREYCARRNKKHRETALRFFKTVERVPSFRPVSRPALELFSTDPGFFIAEGDWWVEDFELSFTSFSFYFPRLIWQGPIDAVWDTWNSYGANISIDAPIAFAQAAHEVVLYLTDFLAHRSREPFRLILKSFAQARFPTWCAPDLLTPSVNEIAALDINPRRELVRFEYGKPTIPLLLARVRMRMLPYREKARTLPRWFAHAGPAVPFIAGYNKLEDLPDNDAIFLETIHQKERLDAAILQERIAAIFAVADMIFDRIIFEKERRKAERAARAEERRKKSLKPDGWSPARRLAYEKSKARRAELKAAAENNFSEAVTDFEV